MVESDAFDPIFDQWDVEIDEKAESFPRKFQVGHELGMMNWQSLLHGLEFDDQFAFDEDVQSVSNFDFQPFVDYRLRLLSFYFIPPP